MTYRLIVKPSAQENVERLPRRVRQRILYRLASIEGMSF
jgi:mRNA-degrading endonuclease RelE of RelBE toxin-antitoxin system